MSPRLTRDDVAHVARLARLRLDDAELDEFTEQLANVLAHAEDIERLDADDVEPTAHPLALRNVFRDDVVRPLAVFTRTVARRPVGRLPLSRAIA